MTEERNEHKLIQEVKRLLDSEGLVTARLVESVTRTAQMASTTVPEIQDLFSQWLSLIGGEVARMAASSPEMDIASTANRIGITTRRGPRGKARANAGYLQNQVGAGARAGE